MSISFNTPTSTSAPAPIDVLLTDGSSIRLRAAIAEDAPALAEFHAGLSEESLRRRFHGAALPSDAYIEQMSTSDWVHSGTLLATRTEPGEPSAIVAVGTWHRMGEDVSEAECGICVDDDLQGRGMGTHLLEALATTARAAGITEFVAEVERNNGRFTGMVARTGFDSRAEVMTQEAHTEQSVHLPIAAGNRYYQRQEHRNQEPVVRSLQHLMRPTSVAVIGASDRPGSVGGSIVRNMIEAGYTGSVHAVNLHGGTVGGIAIDRTIAEVPGPVDLAIVCVPAGGVLRVAGEAFAAGVHTLCVVSAGFAEVGEEGLRRQNELLTMVREHGARLLGPNCLGIAIPPIGLNATFAHRAFPPGTIGFCSQSGALGLALLEYAEARGLGFSSFVSLGNKADVSTNDLLEYWEQDEGTSVALLYVESFGNPRRFSRIARRVARTRPIVALQGGRTKAGATAAGSHTAALATQGLVVNALLEQAGVTATQSLEELVDVTALLASQPLPRGNRVAMLTNAGGLGIVASDACEQCGLVLAKLSPLSQQRLKSIVADGSSIANPVDMLGSATKAHFGSALSILLGDEGVDTVIVLFAPQSVTTIAEVSNAISTATAAQHPDLRKPVVAVIASRQRPESIKVDEKRMVPVYAYPERAVCALSQAVRRSHWLTRGGIEPVQPVGVDIDAICSIVAAALDGHDSAWLSVADAREVLQLAGIPVLEEHFAQTAEQTLTAAQQIGYPVVVKRLPEDSGVHKSDKGGVRTDVRDAADLHRAVADIGLPVTVQPMVTGSAELLVGMVSDPTVGPLVTVAPGGIFVELMGAARMAVAPIGEADIDNLLSDKTATLLAGMRGRPAADVTAVRDVVARVSALADGCLEISELDVNPLFAGPDGCVAADARVHVRQQPTRQRVKTW